MSPCPEFASTGQCRRFFLVPYSLFFLFLFFFCILVPLEETFLSRCKHCRTAAKGPRSQAIAVDYTYPRCLLSDLCRVSFSERLVRKFLSAWFALQSLRSYVLFLLVSVPEDLFSFVLKHNVSVVFHRVAGSVCASTVTLWGTTGILRRQWRVRAKVMVLQPPSWGCLSSPLRSAGA